MSSDEDEPADSFDPRISALKNRKFPLLQSQTNITTIENIEEVVSLIDFELLSTIQSQTLIHHGDRAIKTITRNIRYVGSGGSFNVWRFASGKSRIAGNHWRLEKKPPQTPENPPYSDAFILKRPIVGYKTNLVDKMDPRRLKAVLTEIKVLAHPSILNHQNVVDLLEIFWDTQETGEKSISPSIILEDAPLGSLEAFQKPEFLMLALDMKMEILMDIASGLAALHCVGIVHGDLTTSYVYLLNPLSITSCMLLLPTRS